MKPYILLLFLIQLNFSQYKAENIEMMTNVSQPTATIVDLHLKEYLTIALTSSAAFGRYVVSDETLDKEKCSSVSPNKYLEEAEKISKPGSVAELKAYFESYYNKIGPKGIVSAPLLLVQPSTGDSNDDDEGLASEGTRKVTHEYDLNINAEGSHELVKTEPIVDKERRNANAEESHEWVKTEPIVDKERRNVNAEGSNELVNKEPIVDKERRKVVTNELVKTEPPMVDKAIITYDLNSNAEGSNELVKTEPTVDNARNFFAIPFTKRKEITLVTRPQTISIKNDSVEQKSPSSSREKKKGNINSPKSNPQPIQMAVNSTPIKKNSYTSTTTTTTHFINSMRITTNFVGSKKPTSPFSVEATVGSHNKQRSKVKSRSFDASLRRPWR